MKKRLVTVEEYNRLQFLLDRMSKIALDEDSIYEEFEQARVDLKEMDDILAGASYE
jgi:hypothetical protein